MNSITLFTLCKGFEGKFAVKLHGNNVEVGTSAKEAPDNDKSLRGVMDEESVSLPWTVQDLVTTTTIETLYITIYCVLQPKFIKIQYHAPAIVPLLYPS